jgi:hypothetical protein
MGRSMQSDFRRNGATPTRFGIGDEREHMLAEVAGELDVKSGHNRVLED